MGEKDKIKAYLTQKGISKNRFYTDTGLSIGFLDSGKSLGADKVRIIINTYPDLNIDWLIMDNGPMLKQASKGLRPVESLATRVSEIIELIYNPISKNNDLERIANLMGITYEDLQDFRVNGNYPKTPIDFTSLIKEYPEINQKWLLTGIGEHLSVDKDVFRKTLLSNYSHQRTIEDTINVNKELGLKNFKLQSDRIVEQNFMNDPHEQYGAHTSTQMIPLIPLEAFAGYSPEQFLDIPVEDYYHITEFNQADFLIRVKGDSMTPRFNGGDIVACKKLLERLFFQWHRIYVIYTRSQGVMIKRVEQSERENYIKLVSDNPNYSPFEIPEADIADIALVLGAITLE